MPILASVLTGLLNLYFYVLLARFVIELYLGLSRGARPRGIFLAIFEIILTVTDPPLKLVRKIIRPVRVGPVALDFSWTIVIFLVAILNAIIWRTLG